MKPFQAIEAIHAGYILAALVHGLEWLLRCVVLSALCGIAFAGDRTDRPKSYFIRDAEERPTGKLYAQMTYRADRPKSYFIHDESAKAEFDLPEFEELDDEPVGERAESTLIRFEDCPFMTLEHALRLIRSGKTLGERIVITAGDKNPTGTKDGICLEQHCNSKWSEYEPVGMPTRYHITVARNDKRAEADVEVEEDDAVPAPKFEPTDEPKMQARYRPTFATFLRQAVNVFDDLPEELGDEQPDDFQPLALDFYSPPWCQFCPQVLAKLDVDPRITFNVKKEEFPMAKPNGEPWEYPLIVDPESNTYVRQEFMRSSDTVIEGVNSSRSRRGLALVAAPRDIVVGDVPGELVSPLLSSDEGQWKFKNRAETFTHKAFTVSIPAGLVIRGSSDKRGSRIEFTGEKPQIKVNGFWHLRRNVNSVVATKTAVTLNLNWWQTISFEVR